MSDLINRQAAIDEIRKCRFVVDAIEKIRVLPSAEKPFKLPEIYVAEGFDTVEDEDGNIGFGVYVPAENKIYVAGDVEDEIRARALLHEVCHWVQDMCGRPFGEDEANEFSDIVYDALSSAQPEQRWIPCSERLPEEHEWIGTKKFGTTISDEVYVTFENPEGERFARHLSFQNGKLSSFDQSKIDAFYKGSVPIAWMPLPEPYNGGTYHL